MISIPNLNKLGNQNWKTAFSSTQIPDLVKGVYVVYDKISGVVMYVGSGEVKNRTRCWMKKTMKGKFYVKWRPARRKGEHKQAEYRLIERLQPPGNVSGIYRYRKPLAASMTREQLLAVRGVSLTNREKERIKALKEVGRANRRASQRDDVPFTDEELKKAKEYSEMMIRARKMGS